MVQTNKRAAFLRIGDSLFITFFIVCRADRVSCRGCRSDALFCLCVCRPTWDAEQALPSPRGLL